VTPAAGPPAAALASVGVGKRHRLEKAGLVGASGDGGLLSGSFRGALQPKVFRSNPFPYALE